MFAAAKCEAPGQYCLRAASSHHGPPVPPILFRTDEVVIAGDQETPLLVDLYAELEFTAFRLPAYSSADAGPVDNPAIEIQFGPAGSPRLVQVPPTSEKTPCLPAAA